MEIGGGYESQKRILEAGKRKANPPTSWNRMFWKFGDYFETQFSN